MGRSGYCRCRGTPHPCRAVDVVRRPPVALSIFLALSARSPIRQTAPIELKNLLRVYVDEEGHTPTHVVIHRDGQFYLDCEDLVARLEDASEFIPTFDLVEIRKSGNPRIAEYTDDAFEVAEKGVGFVSDADQHAFLATTGKPELKAGNNPGHCSSSSCTTETPDRPALE